MADFVCNSTIIFTDCVSIAHCRFSLPMPEAVLTDPHRSIQAVHDRCIALAECMQNFRVKRLSKPRDNFGRHNRTAHTVSARCGYVLFKVDDVG